MYFIVPGQGRNIQRPVFVLFPAHGLPPMTGAGLVQVRLLSHVPLPHVVLHDPQDDQPAQRPSTEKVNSCCCFFYYLGRFRIESVNTTACLFVPSNFSCLHITLTKSQNFTPCLRPFSNDPLTHNCGNNTTENATFAHFMKKSMYLKSGVLSCSCFRMNKKRFQVSSTDLCRQKILILPLTSKIAKDRQKLL